MKLKKIFKNNILFSKDCFIFTLIISIFVFVFSLLFAYMVYNSYFSNNNRQLVLTADHIDRVFTETLEETNQLMVYLGRQISSYEEDDLEAIAKILAGNLEFISKNKGVLSWPMFDWVNTKNMLIVNQTGINKNPVNMSHRSYTVTAPQHPWTLQVSRPAIGIPSGLWEIPIGLGITNSKGKYLGTLTSGLEISKLTSKFQKSTDSKKISYIVLDKNYRIILQSEDHYTDPKSSYYREIFKDLNIFTSRFGFFQNTVSFKEIDYYYYKIIPEYDYIILTGYNRNILYKELLLIVASRLIELWSMGLFCLALLYFFKKKILKITYTTEKAREIFLRQINKEMQTPITSILTYSEVILKHLTGMITVGITKERHIEFMNHIFEAASSLYSLTTSTLNLTSFDANQIIKECINIQYHSALIKNIDIKFEFIQNLPPIYADELRFKQIVLGLISLGMEYSPQGGVIKISTFTISKNDKDYLILTLEDNGFGLNKEDIKRITTKFEEGISTVTDLGLSSIEHLIKMHKGTCHLESTFPCGKKFTVTFPYIHEGEQVDPSNTTLVVNKVDNIYMFPSNNISNNN